MIACLLAIILAFQLQIGPDEVIVRSAPYTPISSSIIRTQVDVVEVPVVVRDGKTTVAGLTRENFEILDTGRKRDIASFSVENFLRTTAAETAAGSAAPAIGQQPSAQRPETPRRFIALVLDDLNTDFADLRRAKTAARKFVAESLSSGDLVAVFTTSLAQTVVFTADAQKLQQTIEAVSPHPVFSDQVAQCPVIRAYEAYLIVNRLDDDVLQAKSTELGACRPGVSDAASVVMSMSQGIWATARGNTLNTLRAIRSVVATVGKMPGRRMVLLTSAGFLTGNVEEWLQELMAAALHSGVIINAMDLKGLSTVIPGGDLSDDKGPPPVRWQTRRGQATATALKIQGRMEEAKDDGLAVLATGTGGQFYRNNNDLASGFRTLGALPEVVYVLGFNSGDVAHDGKFHPLKVRLIGHRGTVQARMGYSAPPKDPPPDLSNQHAIDNLVLGSASTADVAVRITAETVNGACELKAIVDLNKLNFDTKPNRRTQKLTVFAALLSETGDFVAGKEGEAELALKDASFNALAAGGFSLSLLIPAAPGKYNLRVVVQESLTGKSSAVGRPIVIR